MANLLNFGTKAYNQLHHDFMALLMNTVGGNAMVSYNSQCGIYTIEGDTHDGFTDTYQVMVNPIGNNYAMRTMKKNEDGEVIDPRWVKPSSSVFADQNSSNRLSILQSTTDAVMEFLSPVASGK